MLALDIFSIHLISVTGSTHQTPHQQEIGEMLDARPPGTERLVTPLLSPFPCLKNPVSKSLAADTAGSKMATIVTRHIKRYHKGWQGKNEINYITYPIFLTMHTIKEGKG